MQERFNDISILRCGAMLMIVFYHCICPFGVWNDPTISVNFHVPIWDTCMALMCHVHLPMFFLIAGYLFGYKRNLGGYNNLGKFIKNKFSRVMVPYVLIGVIIIVIQNQPVKSLFYGISHLWFLMTIFECYLLGRFIDVVLRISNIYKLFVLIICFLLIFFQDRFIISIWGLTIKQFLQYFPVYVIGMILGSLKVCCLKYLRVEYILTIGNLFVAIILACFFKENELLRIFGLFFAISVFLLLRNYQTIKISSQISSLDNCSMGIYIVHHIFIQKMDGINCFHSMMEMFPVSYPVLQFIVVISVSWFMVSKIKKYSWSKYLLG